MTAAPDHVPQPLVEQLKVGGRLVHPRRRGLGRIWSSCTKTADGIERRSVIPVRFVPMTGEGVRQGR